MQIKTYFIPGPILIQPNVYEDARGFFLESFKASVFKELGIPEYFAQDNHSRSVKNVFRGLHFQNPPMEQGKLVRVTRGRAVDVLVDIRKGSPTYGKHIVEELSEQNKAILWIPAGFAHGFLTLDDNTDFLYKVTKEYSKEHDAGISIFDSELGIDLGIELQTCIVSEKDKNLPKLKEFHSPFLYEAKG